MECSWISQAASLRRHTSIFKPQVTENGCKETLCNSHMNKHRHVEKYDIMHGWSLCHETYWMKCYEVKHVTYATTKRKSNQWFHTTIQGFGLHAHQSESNNIHELARTTKMITKQRAWVSLRQQHERWRQKCNNSVSDNHHSTGTSKIPLWKFQTNPSPTKEFATS